MNSNYSQILPPLAGILALLYLNALFVAAEYGVVKLHLSQFNREFDERLRSRRMLRTLMENADDTVRIARFGFTLCTIGYAVVMFRFLQGILAPLSYIGPSGTAILAFIVAFGLHYLLAEAIPRSLAVVFPERALRSAALAVSIAGFLIRPTAPFLRGIERFVLRLFGATPGSELEALDIERQITELEAQPQVSQVWTTLIKNALQIHDVRVQDIILPRNQVRYFDLQESSEENLRLANETEHTRFPLCDGDLDQCVGLIHIKDIFGSGMDASTLDLQKIRRDILTVDPEDRLDETLQGMLRDRAHMALVADEFGGTVGVITLELILEELVGEIQDEFDLEEDLIIPLGDGRFSVSGLAPLRELEDTLEFEFQVKREVTTLSGLITAELGRIPTTGESLLIDRLDVTVTDVDEKRVIAAIVTLRRNPQDACGK